MRNYTRNMFNTFIFHAVASHFVNGLIPVSVLFMLLTLTTADPFYEHTVIHLISIAALAVPLSFISGIRDWRLKFHGAKAPVFYRKIALSIVLALLCVVVISIRLAYSNPLAADERIAWLYGGCIFLTFPVVVILGHYGGRLAYMARQRGAGETGAR